MLIALAMNASASQAGGFRIKLDNGMLTLAADSAPLEDILFEIERRIGISMNIFLSSTVKITVVLESVPIDKGLRLLLRKMNHSFVYKKRADGETPVIASLFIYSKPSGDDVTLTWREDRFYQKRVPDGTIPEYMYESGTLNLHNTNPLDDNPMLSNRGIDPLVRFENDLPDYLPANSF